jgi:glycosyltransferase involved in cell wall biosynthesis
MALPRILPTISIIIPAYNAERWILECLNSCLRQKYHEFEIIVIDDGSTDSTYSTIARHVETHGGPVRVFRTANRGASAARNIGLGRAQGEYVIFLDADDMLAEGALEVLGSIAGETGSDAVFGMHCDFDDETGREWRTPHRKLMYHDDYANIARYLWTHAAALLRKSDLQWNEQRVVWEGLEYLLGFLASGRQAVHTDRIVVRLRQHKSDARLSYRFDHFEPASTGRFFVEQKAKLERSSSLNFERASALDLHILGNAYSLLRAGQAEKADSLFDQISWCNVRKYDWCRFGSLAWVAGLSGQKLGTRGFYYFNKLLGRA